MDSNSDEILNAFSSFQNSFDEDQALREKIRENAIELEQSVRQAMTTLQSIHLETSGDYSHILSKARENLLKCKDIYRKIGECVQPNYYRYHDHWRHVTQKASFCVTLIIFLESQKLASKQEVANELGGIWSLLVTHKGLFKQLERDGDHRGSPSLLSMTRDLLELALFVAVKGEQKEGFHLDLEDYLHGLLQLVSELSRFAVNSAAGGNYTWPVIISKFVNELNAGFRLMNFKNDALRKHYDCFKYDLKKIEEVVYDLSIRGLKTDEKTEALPEATSTST